MRSMLPVDAQIYCADPADALDQVMLAYLMRLAREVPAAKLNIRRLGPGFYDIEGRRVRLRLGIGPSFARDKPLVREEDVKRDNWLVADEVELFPYLRQAADVSLTLRRTALGRIPKDLRVSFQETQAPGSQITLKDIRTGLIEDGNERCQSMRLACEQAVLREQAAVMFERNGPLWRTLGNPNLGRVC
mmetsp:Transcript_60086/g.155259  ORF Transcript_60086/g.155259 Transcript_60086/m.155259 type:complete len:189 (-) Transcript_60086:118-684(-)